MPTTNPRGPATTQVLRRRAKHHAIALCTALCATNLLGCGQDKQTKRQAQAEAAFEAAAKRDPELADPLGQRIVQQVRTHAPGWVKEGHLLRGTLKEHGRRDFLVVLKYGHCYRFVAAAENEAADLDLRLFDENGVERQRDVDQGPTPTLGANAALCPQDASALRLQAHMRFGSGPFAIALLHSPE